MEHESDGNTNRNWCDQYSHKRINTENGEVDDKSKSGDHQRYNIIRVHETWSDLLSLKLQEKTFCKQWWEQLSKE